MNNEIRELDINGIDAVSGGGLGDTIVNVAKEIAGAASPTASVTLPSIPQIGHALAGLGSAIASVF